MTLDPVRRPIFASSEVGTRAATRVRVVNGGAYDGWRGEVHRVDHLGSISVRLAVEGVWANKSIVLPFAASELVDLDAPD